jgi:hypothetical protein
VLDGSLERRKSETNSYTTCDSKEVGRSIEWASGERACDQKYVSLRELWIFIDKEFQCHLTVFYLLALFTSTAATYSASVTAKVTHRCMRLNAWMTAPHRKTVSPLTLWRFSGSVEYSESLRPPITFKPLVCLRLSCRLSCSQWQGYFWIRGLLRVDLGEPVFSSVCFAIAFCCTFVEEV